MAEGIKLTALGKELESNLTRTNTFVYVVNDGQSYKIPIDDLIFDGIINEEKILFNAVTSSKIASESIETRHIKPGFLITEDMLEEGTIGLDKVRIGEFTPAALKAAAASDLANAISDIEGIVTRVGAIETDLSDGGANIFYGSNPPQNPDEGDLWVDASDEGGKVLKRWNGAAWDIIQDADILKAINAAGDAANLADKKISTFYADNPPQNDLVDQTPLEERDTGDLWFDTDDLNKLYRFDYGNWVDAGSPQANNVNVYGINSGWVPVFDQRITDATNNLASALTSINSLSSDITALQGVTDRGINSYYSTTEPLPEDSLLGDLWIDIDDGNKLYRYDGSAWVVVDDVRLTTAMSAATAAANLADGKAQTFFDSVPPVNDLDGTPLGPEDTGDLWFNLSNDNKLYRYDHNKVGNSASFLYNGSYTGWMPVFDSQLAVNASNIADAVSEISNTVLNLSAVKAREDGYVHTFYQTNAPSTADLPQSVQDAGGTISKGDLWIDTDNNNTLYIYLPDNDPAWTPARDTGIQSALTNAARAADIADNKITAYWSNTAPTVDSLDSEPLGVEDDGDLWFDTTPGNNYKVYRWNGSTLSWQLVSDPRLDDFSTNITDALNRLTTAEGKITTIEGLEDGGINSYYQDTMPDENSNPEPQGGDLWYDTVNNHLFRFTSQGGNPVTYAWVQIQDGDITSSFAAALTAAELADGKASVFYSATPPAVDQQGEALTPLDNGDLWFDIDDSNRLYRFDFNTITDNTIGVGSGWIAVTDPELSRVSEDLGAAVTNISGITAREDGYVHSFYQSSKPENSLVVGGLKHGDIWIDTDDGNKIYVYDTSILVPDFIPSQDQAITTAFAAAASAANTADGKISTYYGGTAPQVDGIYNDTLDAEDDGDLWFDTANGNKLYRFDHSTITNNTIAAGSGWIEVADSRIAESAATLGTVVTDLNQAVNNISSLEARADGYVNSFYQDDPPVNADLTNNQTIGLGDIWIDTNNGNALYIYKDGWQLAQDQSIAHAFTAAITAANVADGKVTTYYGDDPPVNDPTTNSPLNDNNTGDIWVEQDNNNKLYRYDHSLFGNVNSYLSTGWVAIYDTRIDSTVSSLADALTAITSLENITDGQVHTFYQNDQPTNSDLTFGTIGVGDLWLDLNDGNKLYFYTGNVDGWQPVQDQAIAQSFAAAASAANTADGKISTYYSDNAPTVDAVYGDALGTEDEGDLWFETDNNNKLHRWSGTQWLPVNDGRVDTIAGDLSQALTDITDLSATIQVLSGAEDGGINSFYQDNTPSTASLGDLWIDTDGGNKLYRYNGTNWLPIDDQAIQTAIASALSAANLADSKVTTHYGPDIPENDLDGSPLGPEDTGDLWIDTNDNNKIYRYDHSVGGSLDNRWILVSDTRLDTLTNDFADTVTNLNTLSSTVLALSGAEDGGVVTFAQDAKPTGTVGDLWVDTNDGNKLYRHNGSDFVPVADESIQTAIQTAVSAGNTADGKIQTFYQGTFPSGLAQTNTGDLFVNTSDNNTMYRYVHDCLNDPSSYQCTGWFNISDSRIATLGNQLTTAEGNISSLDTQFTDLNAKADGKITTFYQDDFPGGPGQAGQVVREGDLFIDKNNGNKLYIFSNLTWTEIQDTAIASSFAAALTAANTADSKAETFYQATAPTGLSTLNNGDIWYDTSGGAQTKVYIYDHSLVGNANSYNSTGWVTTRDSLLTQVNTDLTDAITKVNTVSATVEALEGAADGGITTFYQPNQPTGGSVGDLWLNQTTGQLNRYNGTSWDLVTDCTATNAVTCAQNAANVADSKITSFFQNSHPTTCFGNNCALTDNNTGDIWFDTNDNNKLYRFDYGCTNSGSNICAGWCSVQDANIGCLITDMAQAICDISLVELDITNLTSKVNGNTTIVWYQPDQPNANCQRPDGSDGITNGDLWVDTNDGNRLYILVNGVWSNIQDEAIVASFAAAASAACIADSKIVTYYCNTAPTTDINDGTPLDEDDTGDLWFDTDDNNKLYRWDGNSWDSVQDMSVQENIYEPGTTKIDGGKIYTESICACSIKANSITADQIKARSLCSGQFVVGSIDADAFDGNARVAGTIQSINFDGTVCGTANCSGCWGSRILNVQNTLICSDPTVNPLSKPIGTSPETHTNACFGFNKTHPNTYYPPQCTTKVTRDSYLASIGWMAYVIGGQNAPNHVCSDCFLHFEKRTVENSASTCCQGDNPISTTIIPYGRWQLMRSHVQCNAPNTKGYDICNCNRPHTDYIWPIDFGDGPTPREPSRVCTTPSYSTECYKFGSPLVTDIELGNHGFFLDGDSGTAIFNTIIARDYSISGKALQRRTYADGTPRDGISVDSQGNLVVKTNENTINITDGAIHLQYVPQSLIEEDRPDILFEGPHDGKVLLREVHNVDPATGDNVCDDCKMLPHTNYSNPVYPINPWRGSYEATRNGPRSSFRHHYHSFQPQSDRHVAAVPNFHTGFQHDVRMKRGAGSDYLEQCTGNYVPGMVTTQFESTNSEFMTNEYVVWEMMPRSYTKGELNLSDSIVPGSDGQVVFPANWVTGSAMANRYGRKSFNDDHATSNNIRAFTHVYPPFILGPNVMRQVGGSTGSNYYNSGRDGVVTHSYYGYLSTRAGFYQPHNISVPSYSFADEQEMHEDMDMLSSGVTLYQCQSPTIFIWDLWAAGYSAPTFNSTVRKMTLDIGTLYFNTDNIGRFSTSHFRGGGGSDGRNGDRSVYCGSNDPENRDSMEEQFVGYNVSPRYGGQIATLDLIEYAQIGIEYTWSSSKWSIKNAPPTKKVIALDIVNPTLPCGRVENGTAWTVNIPPVDLDLTLTNLDTGDASVLNSRYLHVNIYIYLQTDNNLLQTKNATSQSKTNEDWQVKEQMGGMWSFGLKPDVTSSLKVFQHNPKPATVVHNFCDLLYSTDYGGNGKCELTDYPAGVNPATGKVDGHDKGNDVVGSDQASNQWSGFYNPAPGNALCTGHNGIVFNL